MFNRQKFLAMSGVFCLAVFAPAQTTVFQYTGADQTYIVPDGVFSLHVDLFGAGGGNSGGSGAGISGDLVVTPGQALKIVVGQAGGSGIYYNLGVAGRTYGGGGSSFGISDVKASQGGGQTAIMVGEAYLATAAGGGGGTAVTIGAHARRGGGYGGIEVGGSGEGAGGGTGGTQTSGGSMFGSFYQGGDPSGPGGGGGGGYFGGGGGSAANISMYALFPGGGGSSLISNLTNVSAEHGQTGSGSIVLPGRVWDADYVTGVGVGGGPEQGGGNGLAVLSVNPVPEPGTVLVLASSLALLSRLRKKSPLTASKPDRKHRS